MCIRKIEVERGLGNAQKTFLDLEIRCDAEAKRCNFVYERQEVGRVWPIHTVFLIVFSQFKCISRWVAHSQLQIRDLCFSKKKFFLKFLQFLISLGLSFEIPFLFYIHTTFELRNPWEIYSFESIL